ncbi:hypothetical protein [Clostridium beijerinckii]|jgi:hypothetical protein|uniref:hypothetical protein n=5 Tax=Clostridium beijerinckii TaxID=1520 RepID=UPI001360B7FC|nr:hypothetical protein [Clostridium beijerinckii]MZK53688.1 hypothetical protein [Clostridium beijerinckii]MZK61817.1 hypothetical protein [Clostridium beijerinckii]MZK71998.1 hypothetical protein [Clostridium beijerinckii]MZK77391.1 hypothetical protein [Clostridium beijerinckii]MZK86969.1 hypothetical protein [Clostridium beijerinckii]
MADYSKTTWYDQVTDQNGNVIQAGTPLSATNMNRMESGIDLADNVVGVMVAETLQKINGINKELEKWQKQRLQQGIAYLYNKYVINGCVVSKMSNSRYVQISLTGTYLSGNVSKISVDGKYAGIADEQMIAMVPMNTDSVSAIYYIYIDYDSVQGRYRSYLAATVPDGKLALYKITVPANDTGMDLTSVTLTDMRRIEALNTIRTTEPYVLVSIPGFPMLDAGDYDVNVTVESASDVMSVGEIIVYDKQANGFKLKITGSADNTQLRWTLMNPDIK